MRDESIGRAIAELRERIRYHEHKYYVGNEPEISDLEFDGLMQRLKALESRHPQLITPDSPTQRIYDGTLDGFQEVPHKVAMLSLDNSYNFTDLAEFDERVGRALGVPTDEIEYVAELKIDGVGIALLYENGVLVRGATRGNGTVGDDITHSIRTIMSVPLRLRAGPGQVPPLLEVRGEAFIGLKEFERINREREEAGLDVFANPRNSTAGTLRQLDVIEVARRRLDVFIYMLSHAEGLAVETHSQALGLMQSWGFKVNPASRVCRGLSQVRDYCDEWQQKRHGLDYKTDGVVVKVNRLDYQERLGQTSKHPRWAIAFKFPAEQATTKVLSIDVQVGRTGAVTPVATFAPVQLSGTTVKRASLHNADEIGRKDIRVGDTVVLEKAGEIIPQVVSVIKSERTDDEKPFRMPENCPVCGSRLVRPEGEVVIRCVNSSCPAVLKESIRHFASRAGLDIDGMGPALIDMLVDRGMVKNYADIFKLNKEVLAALPRMAEKSADNLLAAIEKSKEVPFNRFIYALGIRHVGAFAARALAANFSSVKDLIATAQERGIPPQTELEVLVKDDKRAPKRRRPVEPSGEMLEAIDGIGEIVASSVAQYFCLPSNVRVIEDLLDEGVKIIYPERKIASEEALLGKRFVLTGTLKSMRRDEAKARVESLGGRVTSSVTKQTDYVIVGASPGSKLDKARRLGVHILTEAEFLELIESGK